ncbi:putative glycolipid-binding domain-containing protein [Leptolyngbya sp. FACHB-261]|uniref:putative glycolipid-binding domain-containing protein n=1 Tax=Leptolyngbya sp. FACHB-261 TaxID=2692806 RepID=UPI001683CD6D|nr:putative glycolipid-binding domain-containing protein [Leptolyngbya sp. FACHB-261]MBD2104704.1 putative glycolipid-binding domain-containing protein [Leptolyngbya sp. FACHB-261]
MRAQWITQDVIWTAWQQPGLEHLQLTEQEDQVLADSLLIGMHKQKPFRVRYTIVCDLQWQVRRLSLDLLSGGGQAIELWSDGNGQWTTQSGFAVSALDGCLDLDLAVTPFPHSLAIRRLALNPGESAEVKAVHLTVPKIKLQTSQQRYTCLATGSEANVEGNAGDKPEGGLYRYENLGTGIQVELRLDAKGLVIDYPEAFRRVWSQ